MTLQATPMGLMYPAPLMMGAGTSGTLDASTEKFAMIGNIYFEGRATGSKTLSTGTISWRSGAVTFANGGTTVDIGIQDVATGAGPIAQPDGSFDVKTTLTGGGGGITSNAWQTTTMNSGSKSMSHGDLIAVVWDMTARAGADSVIVGTQDAQAFFNGVSNAGFPVCNAFVSSAWQTSISIGAGKVPNCTIVMDDGTRAIIDFALPINTVNSVETFQDSTNPDERGLKFQVPWDCMVDGFWFHGGISSAATDFTLKLYSDPTGTPAPVTSKAIIAENLSVTGNDLIHMFNLPSEVSLSRNTDYGLAILASPATSNVRLTNRSLGSASDRVFFPGGTSLAKITRNNSAGAFTAESPATTMYAMGIRISQFNDFAGISRARAFTGM